MMAPTEGSKGSRLVDAVLYGAAFTFGAWGMNKLLGSFSKDDDDDDERDDGEDDDG